MDLSIIIVNYNSQAKLRNCLNSIKVSDLGGLNYEVIVVDNASGDRWEDFAVEGLEFKLIRSGFNLGMGGGNNLGFKEARSEFILILNPDTVLRSEAIKIMLTYLKEWPEVAIVGPKLLNPDLSLQYSCSRFPSFFTPVVRRTFIGRFFKKHLNRFLMKNDSHDIIQEVDWMLGSCLMIRRKDFSGFDEKNFFMYFEDVDLCRRAWQAGQKVVYNPRAEVIHCHARDSARHPWYWAVFRDKITREHIKSWFRYFRKWGLNKQVRN